MQDLLVCFTEAVVKHCHHRPKAIKHRLMNFTIAELSSGWNHLTLSSSLMKITKRDDMLTIGFLSVILEFPHVLMSRNFQLLIISSDIYTFLQDRLRPVVMAAGICKASLILDII
jgi:hypothetical protein